MRCRPEAILPWRFRGLPVICTSGGRVPVHSERSETLILGILYAYNILTASVDEESQRSLEVLGSGGFCLPPGPSSGHVNREVDDIILHLPNSHHQFGPKFRLGFVTSWTTEYIMLCRSVTASIQNV
ncbi:hypothetical protein K431DRAFT_143370 [Polychaeton citri CBS 116435]|uniref:Uncharacterized protein n=1 Tax=Polychaeton citri CBS 116435 TaxID=1314669 RepID=A0A9P4UMG5_9PEZI|nr:hypothetical protein K431DRAFT_143370 [Polychaeton citri CBS 116435]